MANNLLPQSSFRPPAPLSAGSPPRAAGEFPSPSEKLWRLAALPMLLFFTIPLVAIFLRISPSDWWQTLQHRSVLEAIRVSLTSSIVSLIVIVIAGTPLAYLAAGAFALKMLLIPSWIYLLSYLPL